VAWRNVNQRKKRNRKFDRNVWMEVHGEKVVILNAGVVGAS
jgi:hypothetical protein